jgi:hypothetical protein
MKRHQRKLVQISLIAWSAIVVICILAVIFGYRVSMGPLEGFRFEPSPQIESVIRDTS